MILSCSCHQNLHEGQDLEERNTKEDIKHLKANIGGNHPSPYNGARTEPSLSVLLIVPPFSLPFPCRRLQAARPINQNEVPVSHESRCCCLKEHDPLSK